MPSTRNLLKRVAPSCFGSTAAESNDPYPDSNSTSGGGPGPKKIQLQYREGRTSHHPPGAAAAADISHGSSVTKKSTDFDADTYPGGRSESDVELVESKRHGSGKGMDMAV